jgi:stage II sporulation protein GA (sporulation sigma-E factor processing peptidase)
LIIDYFMLFGTARLMGVRASRARMLLASVLGGVYSVCVFLPGAEWLSLLPVKLAIGILMCLIVFGGKGHFLRSTLLFFLCTFAFGGCALLIGLVTGGTTMINGVFSPLGARELLAAMLISAALTILVLGRLASHGGLKRDTAACVVRHGGKTAEFTALLDSGNTLSDPLSGSPVIVAEPEALQAVLPPQIKALPLSDAVAVYEELAKAGRNSGFRLIPCRTVGSKSLLLLAFQPEKVTLGGRVVGNALIALSPSPVSDGGGYHALAWVN